MNRYDLEYARSGYRWIVDTSKPGRPIADGWLDSVELDRAQSIVRLLNVAAELGDDSVAGELVRREARAWSTLEHVVSVAPPSHDGLLSATSSDIEELSRALLDASDAMHAYQATKEKAVQLLVEALPLRDLLG